MSEKPTTAIATPKLKKGIRGFFRETVREMKHVTWPTSKETNRLTGVVFAVCIMCVAILYGISTAFGTLFHIVFRGGN